MKNILEEHIDRYLQGAEDYDKRVARHLKEIIPNTTHLDERVFKEIIEELKKVISQEKHFKDSFLNVCPGFILKGDAIKAKLPRYFIRIYLNTEKFLLYIKRKNRIPYNIQQMGMILASRSMERIIRLLSKIHLSRENVVFATFDVSCRNKDPFKKYKISDIINMLALNKDVFENGESYSAVKIKYENKSYIVKRYPTFIDAGWYDKFFPAETNDQYGRTKSLDPSLPGMPEIVHKNMKMSDVIEDIEFLED